jgi:uncharacterized protein YbjT (DUF2867 family)
MTDLLFLGGSGRTGAHVLAQAAARGHRVRALVRNPQAVHVPPGVELIAGTPSSIDDLRKAAIGAQAVIGALNNSRTSDNPWAKPVSPPAFMTDAARNVLTVMGENGIRRIVLASAMGTADDWTRLNPLFRAFIRLSNLKLVWADHAGVDRVVRASATDWTLARAYARVKPARKNQAPGSTAQTSPPSCSTPSSTARGSARRRWSGTPEPRLVPRSSRPRGCCSPRCDGASDPGVAVPVQAGGR